MSRSGLPHDAIAYPGADGQPMAETRRSTPTCMMYVTYALQVATSSKARAARTCTSASNNFLYYEQGNPRAVVAPDVYVVVGAPVRHLRDTYLLWNEPKGPDFVLEVTSKSTRREDERRKRDVYAALGVREYFLYDPRAEYLTPPLQGFRLRGGEYRRLPAVTMLSSREVAVTSEVLGLTLRDDREARLVRLHDRSTGEDLPTYEEADRAREETDAARRTAEARIALEVAARQREAAARQAAEARAAELEARLRKQ